MNWKFICRLMLCLYLIACGGGSDSGGGDDGNTNGTRTIKMHFGINRFGLSNFCQEISWCLDGGNFIGF